MSEPYTTQIDGFGQRFAGVDSETGDQVELLELAPELVSHEGFINALAERVTKFATVRHTSYVHVRRLDRPSSDRIHLVSDITPGWRLSELLTESGEAGVQVDIAVVLGLLRQLLPAVALYSRHNRDAAIGALAPERLIVTPQARLVIAEHAFGPPLDQLSLGRDHLWQAFRVAMPPTTGLPRANQRADATGIGMVSLCLLLGRVLSEDEFPSKLQALADGVREHHDGEAKPLAKSMATWLVRALQLDEKSSYQTPSEAQMAFETVLISERSYVTTPVKLEEWVTKIGARLDEKRPKPEPVAVESEPQMQIVDEPSEQEAEAEQDAAAEEVEIPLDDAEVTIPLDEAEAAAPAQKPALGFQEIAIPEEAPQPVQEPVQEEAAAVEEAPAVQEEEPVESPAPVAQQEEPAPQYQEPAAQYTEPAQQEEAAPVEEEQVEQQAVEEEPVEEEPVEEQPVAEQPIEEPPAPVAAKPDHGSLFDPIAAAIAAWKKPAPKVEEPEPPPPAPPPPPPPPPPPVVVAAPKYEEPAREEPKPVESKFDFPRREEPKYEEPKFEAPKFEAPKVEAPKYEAPKYEAPKYEPPPPAPAYEQRAQYEEEKIPEAEVQHAQVQEEEVQPAPAYAAAPSVAPSIPQVRDLDDDDEKPRGSRTPLLAMAAVIVLLLGVVGFMFTRGGSSGGDDGALKAGEGELVVTTRTPGASVKVDGKDAGVTPATIRLQSGPHVIEVQAGKGEPRVVPVMIKAGVQTAQYVEIPDAPPLSPPKAPAEKGRKR